MNDGITIILPVLNEEKILEQNVNKLISYLTNNNQKYYEIIIANNGSTDKSLELAINLAKINQNMRVVSHPKKGPGRVFKHAVTIAKYDKIISQDMDLSTDIDFILKAKKLLDNHAIVIGSKKSGKQDRSIVRLIPSTIFIILVRTMLGLKYNDYSMAAKGYRRSAILPYLHKVDSGTSYVIDLTYYVRKRSKLRVCEIPVNCFDKRKSKFNIVHESIYRFNNVLRLWKKRNV